MRFHPPLVHGILLKRYKRFLADIQLDNGQIVTTHCANSGSMKSCLEEGAEVFPLQAKVRPESIQLVRQLPHHLGV